MITISQKMIVSFLLSAFIFAAIAALIIIGVFDLGAAISIFSQQGQVLIVPAVFLALFFIIFFYLNLRQDSADDDIPCLVEFSSLGLVDDSEVVELENISTGSGGNISILGRLFTFSPDNPELLQVAGNEVIYEHNGIHYINNDTFNGDKNTGREVNNDFAKLVESVVSSIERF